MKIFLIIALALLSSCSGNGFGKYYEIPEAGIEMPFFDTPVKLVNQNETFKSTDYRYGYEDRKNDSNYLYGAEVIEWKSEPVRNLGNLLDQTSKLTADGYRNAFGGTLGESKWGKFKDKGDCIYQKVHVTIPEAGEIVVTSLFFVSNSAIVRLYVFTPISVGDNQRIAEYFNSIKFD